MFLKKITIIVIFIFCCLFLLSCNYENTIPSKSNVVVSPSVNSEKLNSNTIGDEDLLMKHYSIAEINNISNINNKYYSGKEIQQVVYDFPSIYLTQKQFESIKKRNFDDTYYISKISEKELNDLSKLQGLKHALLRDNDYYFGSGFDELDQTIKYSSKKVAVNEYAYQYYILNLDNFGPSVFYAVYLMDNSNNCEWEYFTEWIYTKGKSNISLENFLDKELLYNSIEDDINYLCTIEFLSSGGYSGSKLYLNNGQTGSISYIPIYVYENNYQEYNESFVVSYSICLNKFNLFDILQEGDEPEEVLKRFNEQAEQ